MYSKSNKEFFEFEERLKRDNHVVVSLIELRREGEDWLALCLVDKRLPDKFCSWRVFEAECGILHAYAGVYDNNLIDAYESFVKRHNLTNSEIHDIESSLENIKKLICCKLES